MEWTLLIGKYQWARTTTTIVDSLDHKVPQTPNNIKIPSETCLLVTIIWRTTTTTTIIIPLQTITEITLF